jgi:ABC-2 type transport system ATP-binding protein
MGVALSTIAFIQCRVFALLIPELHHLLYPTIFANFWENLMTAVPLLSTHLLGKKYPDGYELQPCSLSFFPGTTNAILGANGAGKSTLFNLLSANSHPTSGSISFLGKSLRPEEFSLKQRIGYLPQNLLLPPWISGIELLRYAAGLYKLSNAEQKINQMLSYWDCHSFSRLPLIACSHGMQKRIALGLALLHEPPLLILDEPFSGLDLYHTRALEQIIVQRQRAGKVTILSTHVLPYVQRLCQTVAMIRHGQISTLSSWLSCSAEEKTKKVEDFFYGSPSDAATPDFQQS